MHKVIFVSSLVNKDIIATLSKNFELYIKPSVKDSIIFQVDHPDLSTIIYDGNSIDPSEILSGINKIKILNPMILQIIFNKPGNINFNKDEVIQTLDIGIIIKNITRHTDNRRESNRAFWPIKVLYKNLDGIDKTFNGLVLSISKGGCFVKTDHILLGKIADQLELKILFDTFNFQVNGEILRIKQIADNLSPQGFSVKFIDPTPQTEEFIKELVDDKILSTIFEDFKHLSLEGSNG